MNYPRALLAAYAVVVLVGLLAAGTTSSAAFGAYNPAWDGASDLRAEADAVGADPTIVRNTTEYGAVPARNAVSVVISPDRGYGDRSVGHLRTFVREGGTLVVAEDFGPHANDLLADVGADARVDGRLLRDERHNDRSPAMPVAANVSDPARVGGAEQLTLNHGTAVEPNGSAVLVATSEYGYLDGNRDGTIDGSEELGSYPVVTSERVGAGRVVVVGDPSLLVNAMLDRPDNRAFVRGLFDGDRHVFLDYSHAERLPPLALARLTVQRSPLLQFLLGLGLVLGIAFWARGRGVRWHDLGGLRSVLTRGGARSGGGSGPAASEDALVRYLSERHPEWDESRVERVVRTARPERVGDLDVVYGDDRESR